MTVSSAGLVLLNHCAQPGDNAVDHTPIAVGSAARPWDAVWAPGATISPIPRLRTDQAPSSTSLFSLNLPSDLRGREFSTLSTAPKTTSLRQGLRMTKDVRDKQPSAVQGITLSSTSNLIMTSSLPAILTSHGGAA
jgi:hypothetical protein